MAFARRAALQALNAARTASRPGQIVPVFAARYASNLSAAAANVKSSAPKKAAALGFAASAAGLAGMSVASADAPSDAPVDLEAVRHDIEDLVEQGHGPVLVRLAWHAAGTYDASSKSGGSNGATMRFSPEIDHSANAGLAGAQALLEPVKAAHTGLSYADLWTLAGSVAIEAMGGPAIVWQAGRKDADGAESCPPDGRLPNADMGQPGKTVSHLRAIFHRMGFTDAELVCLSGAHALGRCHTDRSGFWGPWTRAETTFSNEYFRELLENTWTLKKWDGPEQYEDPTGELMMLPSDVALVQEKALREHVEKYARDQDLFFKDFAAAFQKLMELGVPFNNKPWYQFW